MEWEGIRNRGMGKERKDRRGMERKGGERKWEERRPPSLGPSSQILDPSLALAEKVHATATCR